jgi:hypothetical protein
VGERDVHRAEAARGETDECACIARADRPVARIDDARRRASPCSGPNSLPILAGTVLFGEGLPAGWRGAARIAAFGLVLVGAVALSRPDADPPFDALEEAGRLSID